MPKLKYIWEEGDNQNEPSHQLFAHKLISHLHMLMMSLSAPNHIDYHLHNNVKRVMQGSTNIDNKLEFEVHF